VYALNKNDSIIFIQRVSVLEVVYLIYQLLSVLEVALDLIL